MANFESDPLVEVAEPGEQSSPQPAGTVVSRDGATHRASPKSIAREYFESIVVTLVMALFGMTFITQAVKVPTGSMLNTILVEDHLMVNKFQLAPHPDLLEGVLPYRDIKRGDVIVFKYPRNPEENYVKRVIGLPGDTIEIRGTRVFINGAELPENKLFVGPQRDDKADLEPTTPVQTAEGATWTVYYGEASRFEDSLASNVDDEEPAEVLGDVVVDEGEDEAAPGFHDEFRRYAIDEKFRIPAGQYFCLGDNRDNSQDSRYWGTVPRENIIGRAMFVYWSLDESARLSDPEPSSLLVDIVRHTRWGRTFTGIR